MFNLYQNMNRGGSEKPDRREPDVIGHDRFCQNRPSRFDFIFSQYYIFIYLKFKIYIMVSITNYFTLIKIFEQWWGRIRILTFSIVNVLLVLWWLTFNDVQNKLLNAMKQKTTKRNYLFQFSSSLNNINTFFNLFNISYSI